MVAPAGARHRRMGPQASQSGRMTHSGFTGDAQDERRPDRAAKFNSLNTLRPMFRAIYNLGMPLRLKSCALNSLDFSFFF
jgi:hypothetical protein